MYVHVCMSASPTDMHTCVYILIKLIKFLSSLDFCIGVQQIFRMKCWMKGYELQALYNSPPQLNNF